MEIGNGVCKVLPQNVQNDYIIWMSTCSNRTLQSRGAACIGPIPKSVPLAARTARNQRAITGRAMNDTSDDQRRSTEGMTERNTSDDQRRSTEAITERSTADDSGIRDALKQPLSGQSAEGLPLEAVFDILRNERRQQVLGYLAVTGDDVIRIGELAEHVAAVENDVAVAALSSQQRKRVYVALYQCHLPKMADANVIEFDKDRGTIHRGRNAEQITPYLDVQPEAETDPLSLNRPLAVFAASCLLAYVLAASLASAGVLLGGVTIVAGLVVGLALEYRNRDRNA